MESLSTPVVNPIWRRKKVFTGKRMQREEATVEKMIRRYCRDKHMGSSELCADCWELLEYARKRLANCPFQENKTTCGKCPVHCYKPVMREKIRDVMRCVGPRLLLTDPILSFQHALDGLRKEPRRVKKRKDE